MFILLANLIFPIKYIIYTNYKNIMHYEYDSLSFSYLFEIIVCLFVLEILEDKYMLRCLQLFHQKPTLPDLSILHCTQVHTNLLKINF